MSSLPLETITLIFSTVVGVISKLIGMSIAAKREQQAFQLQLMAARDKSIDEARRYDNPQFQWTRRAISLITVFFVIAFPKIVAVFCPTVPVVIGYTELQKGWIFSNPVAHTVWQNAYGLTITPLDTHMLAAIIGLYFGGSLAQH